MNEIFIRELSPIRRNYLLFTVTQFADYYMVKSCMKENRTLPSVILKIILDKVELMVVGQVIQQWHYCVHTIILHNDLDNCLSWTQYFNTNQKMEIFMLDQKFKKKGENLMDYMHRTSMVGDDWIQEAKNYLALL